MADPPDLLTAFAAPTAPVPLDRRMLRRGARFAFERVVRLAVSIVAVPTLAVVTFGALGPGALAAALGLAVALWFPATAVLFRATFLPSPPDPWLLDDEGRPLSARDLRAVVRATAAEFALGVIPLLAVVPLVLSAVEVPVPAAIGVAAGLALVVLLRDGRHLLALWLDDIAIDLAAGDAARAARRLLRWVAVPGLSRSDPAWHLLARAAFRLGDPPGALRARGQIRARAGYRVDLLRAQMGISLLGSAEVRRVAGSVRGDLRLGFVAGLLDALADLHDGHPERVRQAADALLDQTPTGESRRVAMLLVAAALSTDDPARARQLLREAAWDPARLETLRLAWPAVGRDLAALAPW